MPELEKVVEVRVNRAFARSFARVHAAFGTSPDEIEEAKAVARANMVAAEDGYYATAELLDAGWEPMREQLVDFVRRTGYVLEARWPIECPDVVHIEWPERKRAA